MSLPAGTSVGAYEVTGSLGAGGMGEVYRARDTKLNRDVALKVLPDGFAGDPDRLARFRREAQVLASLSHPHIAAIYGLEESAGPLRSGCALVLEFVDGETLAERIARGPIPLDDTLSIARQIAEALEAAHEQGIVHRDLKPSNIKLRPDGTVKILDFGLAKMMEGSPGTSRPSGDLSLSPTITSPLMTGLGVILGTAACMSPEQARGRVIDKRTDIWAFGCVLYEMLTGRRAFDGEDATDTIASIVRGTPDWGALPADVPPAVRLLVQRCLEKDRKQRVGDISTALFLMREAASVAPSASGSDVGVPAPRERRWRPLVYSLAAATVAILATNVATWRATRPEPPHVVRLEVAVPPIARNYGHHVAIARDASTVAYIGVSRTSGGIVPALFARHRDALALVQLAERAGNPFFDPRGEWIGFFDGAARALKRVAVTGGATVEVAPLMGTPRGATWGEDGTIVFATATPDVGLQRVSIDKGAPAVLTTPDRAAGEVNHVWPRFLPGGRVLLFTILSRGAETDTANAQIAVLDLREAKPTPKIVVRGGSDAHYAASGHLVYLAGGSLRAKGFDLDRLETFGPDVPVLSQVGATGTAGEFDLADDGTLVYSTAGAAGGDSTTMVWVDRQGHEEPIPAPPKSYLYPRLSWNGDRVAVDVRQDEDDIWTWDLNRKQQTKITKGQPLDRVPVWSADDRFIIFSSDRDGASNLFWQSSDGNGGAERLTKREATHFPLSVSPRQSILLLSEGAAAERGNIMMLSLPSLTKPGPQSPSSRGDLSGVAAKSSAPLPELRPLLTNASGETNAEISPDGRWLVYQSNESGSWQIYASPFPAMVPRDTVSTGVQPHFSRDGRELFFVTTAGALMSVPIGHGGTWREVAGAPKQVLDGQRYYLGDTGGRPYRMYDVTKDGQKFLLLKPAADPSQAAGAQLFYTQNWLEELKRLVPAHR